MKEKQATADFLERTIKCDLEEIHLGGFKKMFLKNGQTTSDLARCIFSGKCDLHINACTSPSLNKRQEHGCSTQLHEARKCYLSGERRDSLCPFTRLMENCYGHKANHKPPCIEKFEKKCSSARISATKVVRLSMQAVEEIIFKIPDIFIVYLVRDPRGIWLSRRTTHAKDHPIRPLCEQMFNDHNMYTELNIKFPGVFLKVKYEEFAENPIKHASDIYSHIGEKLTDDLQSYIKSITHNTDTTNERAHGVDRVDSNQTAHAWMTKVDKDSINQMTNDCHAYLDIDKYLIA